MIRELKHYVQYGPRELPYLMVLIQHAEKMSTEAANSFLKILEEPPADVFFILETAQQDAIVKTIHSRCQKIIFDQLPESDLLAVMTEQGCSIESQELALSGGLLNSAQTLQAERDCVRNLLTTIDTIKQRSLIEIADCAETIASSRERSAALLQVVLQYLRNARRIAEAMVVYRYLKILQKNVNLRLTVEVMLMKLRVLS
jgi:DNA polymerase-3 subunit delta'